VAGETTIVIAGNLVDEVDLRFTPAGHAVAKFRVASTPRTFDKSTNEWRDGDSLFLTVSAWRKLGEHCAETLKRGTRVIVQGALKQRSYEDREGVKRTIYEVEAEDVAPSLKNATAVVTKANSGQQHGRQTQQGGAWSQQNPGGDPWASNDGTQVPF
jgi:single-strand DNA-binding protein